MKLINDGDSWYWINPKFPETKLSLVFESDALALQWRGRVGCENFGDIEELQKELDDLNNGRRVVMPKNKEHAEEMIRVATFALRINR